LEEAYLGMLLTPHIFSYVKLFMSIVTFVSKLGNTLDFWVAVLFEQGNLLVILDTAIIVSKVAIFSG
jgi:hypothetical protein